MTDEWKSAKEAPDGVTVETKIHDELGCRNVCLLKRNGNLWWFLDGSMYVYYTPTHYREYDPRSGGDK